MSTDFGMTKSEQATIRSFVNMLNDESIRPILMLRVAKLYGEGEAQMEALNVAIKKLSNTCGYSPQSGTSNPQRAYKAAPSLSLLTRICHSVSPVDSLLQVPEDLLPSIKLMEGCTSRFFDDMREQGAKIPDGGSATDSAI